MNSVLLKSVARTLFPLQLIFAVYLLLRGHNLPGGGFIAGLVAASAYVLWSLSYGVELARRKLAYDPEKLVGLGLSIAITSGLVGSLSEAAFMKGIWGPTIPLPIVGSVSLGTPFLFDVGVFFVVAGVTLLAIFALHERSGGHAGSRRVGHE